MLAEIPNCRAARRSLLLRGVLLLAIALIAYWSLPLIVWSPYNGYDLVSSPRDDVYAVALGSSNSTSIRRRLELREWPSGRTIFHADAFGPPAFSPTTSALAFYCADDRIRLATLEGRTLAERELPLSESMLTNRIAFTPSGERLIALHQNRILVLDGATLDTIYEIRTGDWWPFHLAVSGDRLAVSCTQHTASEPNCEIRLFDLRTISSPPRIIKVDEHPFALAWADDRLVARTYGSAIVWRFGDEGDATVVSEAWVPNNLLPRQYGSQPIDVNSSVALFGTNLGPRVVDLDTFEQAEFSGLSGSICDVAFAPDSSAVMGLGEDGEVIRWDLTTGDIVAVDSANIPVFLKIAVAVFGGVVWLVAWIWLTPGAATSKPLLIGDAVVVAGAILAVPIARNLLLGFGDEGTGPGIGRNLLLGFGDEGRPDAAFLLGGLTGLVGAVAIVLAMAPGRLVSRCAGLLFTLAACWAAPVFLWPDSESMQRHLFVAAIELALLLPAALLLRLWALRLWGVRLSHSAWRTESDSIGAGRFSILDLLLLMTGVALLFAIARCTTVYLLPMSEMQDLAIAGAMIACGCVVMAACLTRLNLLAVTLTSSCAMLLITAGAIEIAGSSKEAIWMVTWQASSGLTAAALFCTLRMRGFKLSRGAGSSAVVANASGVEDSGQFSNDASNRRERAAARYV